MINLKTFITASTLIGGLMTSSVVNADPKVGTFVDATPIISCSTHEAITDIMQSIKDNKLKETLEKYSTPQGKTLDTLCKFEPLGVITVTAIDDIGIINEPLVKHNVHFWILTLRDRFAISGFLVN